MKPFFLYLVFALFIECLYPLKNELQGGVYIVTTESFGPEKNSPVTKFSDDSIFVLKTLAIEKLMQLNQSQFNNEEIKFTESIGNYYLIDLKKQKFKDIGNQLEKETKKINWQDLKNKPVGLNFYYGWYRNEPFKISQITYKGKKLNKINFTNKISRIKYEILLSKNLQNNENPVFFIGIEDKFNSQLVEMKAVFPDNQGTIKITKKFVPLNNHEVLRKLGKCTTD